MPITTQIKSSRIWTRSSHLKITSLSHPIWGEMTLIMRGLGITLCAWNVAQSLRWVWLARLPLLFPPTFYPESTFFTYLKPICQVPPLLPPRLDTERPCLLLNGHKLNPDQRFGVLSIQATLHKCFSHILCRRLEMFSLNLALILKVKDFYPQIATYNLWFVKQAPLKKILTLSLITVLQMLRR